MKIDLIFLVFILKFVEEATTKGVCISRMVNGKWQNHGDCDNAQQSQVMKDLDNSLKQLEKPKDCRDIAKFNTKKLNGGLFDIYPESLRKKVKVYCDLNTDGGGWTVFQRRIDGSENFYRGWNDYVNGFGVMEKEFWLGLDYIHEMTKNGNYELRVDLEDFNGNTAFAKYDSFSVDGSAAQYSIHFSTYTGTAGNSLRYHNGRKFTTKDVDHDGSRDNCAVTYRTGGWWFGDCHESNLNGNYYRNAGEGYTGVVWRHWKNRMEYLKFSEMKFRRKD